MSGRSSKAAADNRANQMNPNNDAYYSSRGMSSGSDSAQMSGGYGSGSGGYANSGSGYPSQAAVDNRANQMNPNNPSYAKSRGR